MTPSLGQLLDLTMLGFKDHTEEKPAFHVTRDVLVNRAVAVGSTLFEPSGLTGDAVLAMTAFKAAALEVVLSFEGQEVTLQPWQKHLEKSEKGSLSFWIGMSVAALLAERFLSCNHLAHVSQLAKDPQETLWREPGSTANDPDFIGVEHGRAGAFHVIEAKGRQAPPREKDQDAWLEQARRIVGVGDEQTPPLTRSFACTSLTPSVQCLFRDPPARERGRRIGYDAADFFQRYYRPHREAIRGRAATFRIGDRVVRAAPKAMTADGQWLYAGLDEAVERQLKDSPRRPPTVLPLRHPALTVGSDGIATVRFPNPCVKLHEYVE